MNISSVARTLCIQAKTLYRWYRDNISDYQSDIKSGKWKKDKIMTVDTQTGEVLEEKSIYIIKKENITENMSIDDKQIGNDTFTILSSKETGKIALLVESVKKEEVKKSLQLFENKLDIVKSITCDMAPGYLSVCQEMFPNAETVIDKFHVMKYAYNAVQDVRIQIVKKLNTQLSKGKIKTTKDKLLLSDLEMLRRSRYVLNKSECDWTVSQRELIFQVFQKFPKLKESYDLVQHLKKWYNPTNKIKHKQIIEKELINWYDAVQKSKIKAFDGVVKMIEKHEEKILNYFTATKTNAMAEAINGNIQRFITSNYGFRDKDFALYRIAGYFS